MASPAVLGLHNARQLIRDKETLIVDGTRGVIIVNPDQRVLEEYQLKKSIELERSKLKRLKTARTATLDGINVSLQANIELPSDVAGALEGGAEGVGLFRTEFLFLDRGDMPTEDEQFEAYRKVVKGMEGRPVTIRTFDLGATTRTCIRKAPGRPQVKTNPALGLRAIRCLAGRAQDVPGAAARHPARVQIRQGQDADSDAGACARDRPDAGAIEQAKSSLRGEKIAFDENRSRSAA
jgi:phosphotransferase system enzyme I (PtsI)